MANNLAWVNTWFQVPMFSKHKSNSTNLKDVENKKVPKRTIDFGTM